MPPSNNRMHAADSRDDEQRQKHAQRYPMFLHTPPPSSSKALTPAATTSTIHDLPFDILSLILELVISLDQTEQQEAYLEKLHDKWLEQFAGCSYDPEEQLDTERVLHKPCTASYHLGRVCRTWRATTLLLPSMWSRVIYTPSTHDDPRHGVVSHLRQALTRSRGAKLDVIIWLPRPRDCGHSQWQDKKLLDDLIDTSPRWRSLRIYVAPSCESDLFTGSNNPLARIAGCLPRLQSLAVACDDTNVPLHKPITLFDDAQSLGRVEMSGVGKKAMVIPWGRVKALMTRCLLFKDTLELVRSCESLERWRWEPMGDVSSYVRKGRGGGVCAHPTASSSAPKIELANLKELEVDVAAWAPGGTGRPAVLESFGFPRLARLRLRTEGGGVRESGVFTAYSKELGVW